MTNPNQSPIETSIQQHCAGKADNLKISSRACVANTLDTQLVKLTLAKEQGLFSEDEYGKVRSILKSPVEDVSEEEDD